MTLSNATACAEVLKKERDQYARNADYYRLGLDYVATTMVAECDKLRAEVARLTAAHGAGGEAMQLMKKVIEERLAQHRENLSLWLNHYLDSTEPDVEERVRTCRGLQAAIHELEYLQQFLPKDAALEGE